MIDLPLTDKIKAFLDTPHDERDYAEGARLLGKVSRNRVLYANVSRDPAAKASAIVYHLGKILKTRLADVTREQVKEMMAQVDSIAEVRGLQFDTSAKSDFQKGRRADHDSLPPEVRRLWVENGEIRQRMRDCHTKLRLINPSNSTCPDSDRYPFAKEIIELDTKYRDNWNVYDHYIPGTPVASTPVAVDRRTASNNAARTANMLLGKYAKKPDDALAARIREAFAKVAAPTPALVAKMKEAGLA